MNPRITFTLVPRGTPVAPITDPDATARIIIRFNTRMTVDPVTRTACLGGDYIPYIPAGFTLPDIDSDRGLALPEYAWITIDIDAVNRLPEPDRRSCYIITYKQRHKCRIRPDADAITHANSYRRVYPRWNGKTRDAHQAAWLLRRFGIITL